MYRSTAWYLQYKPRGRRPSTATGFPAFLFPTTLSVHPALLNHPPPHGPAPDDLVRSTRMGIFPPQRRPQSGAAAHPPCCHGSSARPAPWPLAGPRDMTVGSLLIFNSGNSSSSSCSPMALVVYPVRHRRPRAALSGMSARSPPRLASKAVPQHFRPSWIDCSICLEGPCWLRDLLDLGYHVHTVFVRPGLRWVHESTSSHATPHGKPVVNSSLLSLTTSLSHSRHQTRDA